MILVNWRRSLPNLFIDCGFFRLERAKHLRTCSIAALSSATCFHRLLTLLSIVHDVRFHPASNTVVFVALRNTLKTAILTALKRYQAQYVSIFGELYWAVLHNVWCLSQCWPMMRFIQHRTHLHCLPKRYVHLIRHGFKENILHIRLLFVVRFINEWKIPHWQAQFNDHSAFLPNLSFCFTIAIIFERFSNFCVPYL